MQIIDNLFDKNILESIRFFIMSNCEYGWKSTKTSNQQIFHKNFVLDKVNTQYVTSNNQSLTWDNFIKEFDGSQICDLSKYISKNFFNGKKLTRIYANIQFSSQETDMHRDYDIKFFDTCKTVVLYLSELKSSDGGYTIIVNDNDEIVASIRPSFGRLLEFNGCMLHGVSPMSKYYNEPRVALVFGLEDSLNE